jgi:hypothetical protein
MPCLRNFWPSSPTLSPQPSPTTHFSLFLTECAHAPSPSICVVRTEASKASTPEAALGTSTKKTFAPEITTRLNTAIQSATTACHNCAKPHGILSSKSNTMATIIQVAHLPASRPLATSQPHLLIYPLAQCSWKSGDWARSWKRSTNSTLNRLPVKCRYDTPVESKPIIYQAISTSLPRISKRWDARLPPRRLLRTKDGRSR